MLLDPGLHRVAIQSCLDQDLVAMLSENQYFCGCTEGPGLVAKELHQLPPLIRILLKLLYCVPRRSKDRLIGIVEFIEHKDQVWRLLLISCGGRVQVFLRRFEGIDRLRPFILFNGEIVSTKILRDDLTIFVQHCRIQHNQLCGHLESPWG